MRYADVCWRIENKWEKEKSDVKKKEKKENWIIERNGREIWKGNRNAVSC